MRAKHLNTALSVGWLVIAIALGALFVHAWEQENVPVQIEASR